jgi:SNF2 family DNA or RNA helicase
VETDQRDWFDLGVLVHVGDKSVPFGPLFTALAKGQKKLLLIDNSYLSLAQPVFDRLKELISEAQTLAEWETGPRISRYQASLWADFEDLADQSQPAAAWRESVGGLLELMAAGADAGAGADADAGAGVDAHAGTVLGVSPDRDGLALPPGLNATLRPYQQDGYAWLTFLWRHELGGILADDMGLGKTLQTLTLIAHTRAVGPGRRAASAGERRWSSSEARAYRDQETSQAADLEARSPELDTAAGGPLDQRTVPSAPFLVVAPTSVVSNWVAEAARFTPGLRVASVTKTQAKNKKPLADSWAGADIVVTSYTLFRLDFEAYRAQEWAGLVLDEAQFVKNHASRAHQAARDLRAPFKLAVTGTPMENNLMELWSLLAIVAPGLFPSSRRFAEDYVRPIAAASSPAQATPAEHGAELLARLRRRIRPLIMRRTKELVAPELPPKQEQVLQIELAPRHRKLYDTYLQRERQKLFGLLDDLDKNRFIVFRSLTLLRMLSLDASLIDDEYENVPSSKLDALFEQLDDVLAEGHRALIFSQFTSFLGKAAARLDAAGVDYAYLDGSTRQRASVIAKFKDGAASVFLISLKAGGFGLNLTEADYVFMLDPWWNPATESQAVDRTHRIGQDKSVMVYRLVATGTIEEKVMALKEQKARLFDAVLDDDAVFSSALTAEDIRGLLES